MTTIAWDGRALAGDRLVTEGSRRVGLAPKIFRLRDGRLVGFAGQMAPVSAAIRWLEEGGSRPEWPEGFDALEILPNRVVVCHERFGALVMGRGVQVLGAGGAMARAAIDCGKTAAEAVRIAARFDTTTGGKIDVLVLKP